MKKTIDLIKVGLVYIIAYIVGIIFCRGIDNIYAKLFIFDIVATVVTFAFSVLFKNSSVYDAYWSLTPMVMSFWLFGMNRNLSLWQILFFIAFNLWSVRLTFNWCIVFTDFSYEDWRYRKFRDENSPFMWFIINFFGIHMVPTLVVFAGFLPVFVIAENPLNASSLLGIAVILFGVVLEYFADRQMHAFLNEEHGMNVCRKGLWNYSRHPNYLGEISVWLGTFLTLITCAPAYWKMSVGFISVALLFNVVSIPLMEKRQLSRREDYAEYKKQTSRLLLKYNRN